MTIHIVQAGETIEEIAEKYGVSTDRLIQDNVITNPTNLLPGQNIVIQYTGVTYTVQTGDTLLSIAEKYQTTVIQLLQNNPILSSTDTLYPGQTIVITYTGEKLGAISFGGYAYPFIAEDVLRKTLPYLTYLSIFTYGFNEDGSLNPIDDEKIISLAREYGVAPLMLISTLTKEGTFSNALAHTLFTNEQLQDTLINNILTTIKEKNYFGLDIDFEFVFAEDAAAYADFVNKVRSQLNDEGYEVIVSLAPKISNTQKGLLYEGHSFKELGAAANSVLLMTYEWGYTYGPPMAVAPINKVKEVLDYAVTETLPAKIFMGVPNYGYDWTLPFVKGESKAQSLGNVQAVDLAIQYNAPIQWDNTAQSPYFNYTDKDGKEHEVWFENARSIEEKLRLIPAYQFQGATYWNIMKFFPQSWLVGNALFQIRKLLT